MSNEPKKVEAISVGIGLRDKFAMAALTGITSTYPTAGDLSEAAENMGFKDGEQVQGQTIIAMTAYRIADAMMEARK